MKQEYLFRSIFWSSEHDLVLLMLREHDDLVLDEMILHGLKFDETHWLVIVGQIAVLDQFLARFQLVFLTVWVDSTILIFPCQVFVSILICISVCMSLAHHDCSCQTPLIIVLHNVHRPIL